MLFGFGKPKKEETPMLFQVNMPCDGQNYESWNKKGVLRSTLLRNVKIGSGVQFKQVEFKGKPLFTVLDSKGRDICCVPAPFGLYLSVMISDVEIFGTLLNNNPPVTRMYVHGYYRNDPELYDGTPGERGKDYTYNVESDGMFAPVPVAETMCTLVETEDSYDVMCGGIKVGTIPPERKEKLKSMLQKYHCITTIRTDPHPYKGELKMELRF